MKRTFALILAGVAAAALFGGLVHAVLVAAHLSEPAATTVHGPTPQRLWAATVDVVALVPLLAGTALLAGGLWRRRQALDAALGRRPWLARGGAFVAGLGLRLLVASVYAFFWWWAIGATLLSVALLAAAVVAARSEGPRARGRTGPCAR